jgi:cyclopropane-fatty-acyl-phospholipid synthase
MGILQIGIDAVERGFVPDPLTRASIRHLCRERLRESHRNDSDGTDSARQAFFESLRGGPIAPLPEKANEQHYELPPEFFAAVLGPHRKYSCCYFENQDSTLPQAEEAALVATCARAQLADGQDILELGCGWGSLSLWMAEQFPESRITAVSNSAPQKRFIEAEARSRGLGNLKIVTADMNTFIPGEDRFDRVVSVEMFEQYAQLRAAFGPDRGLAAPRRQAVRTYFLPSPAGVCV